MPKYVPREAPVDTVWGRITAATKKEQQVPKKLWERVDTGKAGYDFRKYFDLIVDNCRLHKGIAKQKHACWKLWVEQLLEESMGFTVQAEGNMLRKGDEVFDTWESIRNWFWAIIHLWSPNFIHPREEFGEVPWSYCLDEDSPVWKGIKFLYDFHRDELVAEAMAHLINTDNEDKLVFGAPDSPETKPVEEPNVPEEEKKTELLL